MAKKTVKKRVSGAAAKSGSKKKTTSQKASARSQRVYTEPRRVKPAPKRFRFHKPIRHPVKLPNVWQLTKTSASILWQNQVLFIGITVVYAVLSFLFVFGLSSINATSASSALHHYEADHLGTIFSSISTFGILIGSSASSSNAGANSYQLILILTSSLAIIWALRQVMSGNQIRVRDAFYQGMYPLVPFSLVLLAVCVQLIPLVIGASLYATVSLTGIAVGFVEKAFWLGLFILLALWSLYMVSSSIFAIYIVTLEDMTPIKALRSARQLVRHRRSLVFLRVLYLPVLLLLIAAIIMLPTILLVPAIAPFMLFLLTMSALVAVHAYMYSLYRELLHE